MEPVVIDRAQTRERHRAALVALGQVGVSEESLQIKRLPLDEKVVLRGNVRKHHVPAIGRKHHRVRLRIHRPRIRFEFAIKKLVKRSILARRFGKLRLVQPVLLDEWRDANVAFDFIHLAPVPGGDNPSAEQQPLREPAKRIAVHPAQTPLAINGFCFQPAVVAIHVAYLATGQVFLNRHRRTGYLSDAGLEIPRCFF